ncbi:MAG: hypothetical protein ACRDYX_21155, partial [Egibacteraceae bacterium]
TVYGLTSMAADKASPARLAGLARGRWGIANGLRWVRDVTFDEDRSQVRTGSGPRVTATLRDLAIGVLRLAGAANIAQRLRWAACPPPGRSRCWACKPLRPTGAHDQPDLCWRARSRL